MLDLFGTNLFPWPKVAEEMSVPLAADITGAEYLEVLARQLDAAFDRWRPELIVYNAGSDVLATDPLTDLALTDADLAERDLVVATAARDRGIALAMLLSGGYGPHSWQAHVRSIEGILTRFDAAVAS